MALAEAEALYRGPKRNYRCARSLEPFFSGRAYAVSSDGSFLACAYDDKVKLVDLSTASVRTTLEGDTEDVTALVLGPDDKFLFSASNSRLIRVWEVASSRCVRSWKGNDGSVMAMACHSSGGLLATAGSDRKVLVWDVDGGFCTHFFKGHGGVVTCVMFHPDPNCLFLFSGSEDATVRVWNLESKKCIAVLEKHFSTVTSLSISKTDKILLSAGRDKVVNVWDLHDYSFKKTVPTYETLETVKLINPRSSLSACFHTAEHTRRTTKGSGHVSVYFLTVGEKGIIRVWSFESALCLYEQQSSDTTAVSNDVSKRGFISAVILPFSESVLCVTDNQQFLLYNVTQTLDGGVQLSLQKRLIGNNAEVFDMKFLGEEDQFLAVVAQSEEVRLYDVASMSCSFVLAGHTGPVLCIDSCLVNTGETYVVTGSKDNTARLWNIAIGKCIGIATGHMGAVGAVAFSKRQKNFFVSGSRTPSPSPGTKSSIKVWSLDSLHEKANDVPKLKAKAIVAAHDGEINCFAVSPDDGLLCSGSQDRTACVWRLPDLVSVVVLTGHKRGIWSVEFSPVDKGVITASGDRTIKYWLITDGSCLRTFEGHTAGVLRASFVTRGMQIVSCGADGLVKLWNVKTSECISTYDKHEGKIWSLAVGRKAEMLATGGDDAVINLWHDSTADDLAEESRKTEEDVLKDKELQNAQKDEDYVKTIRLALELRMPHKLCELLSEICRKELGEDPVERVVRALGKEELQLLLEFIREWNTRSQHCHVAHFTLFQIFKAFSPTEIIKIKGVSELLEGLIPYSQRHYGRLDRLSRSMFLLDYTLARMRVIEPETSTSPSKDENVVDPDNVGQVFDVLTSNDVDDVKNGDQMHDSSHNEDSRFSKKRGLNKSRKDPKKRIRNAEGVNAS